MVSSARILLAAAGRRVRHRSEEALAFDTMCSWIYEDALPITRHYHARLVAMADEMDIPRSVQRLDELLID